MKDTISKDEYFILRGLQELGRDYHRKENDIVKNIAQILDEDEYTEWSWQLIWDNEELDSVLETLQIRVDGKPS
jgi:hypothetical protein